MKKYECENCGEKFFKKKDLINHLEMEIVEAEETIAWCTDQLEELLDN